MKYRIILLSIFLLLSLLVKLCDGQCSSFKFPPPKPNRETLYPYPFVTNKDNRNRLLGEIKSYYEKILIDKTHNPCTLHEIMGGFVLVSLIEVDPKFSNRILKGHIKEYHFKVFIITINDWDYDNNPITLLEAKDWLFGSHNDLCLQIYIKPSLIHAFLLEYDFLYTEMDNEKMLTIIKTSDQ